MTTAPQPPPRRFDGAPRPHTLEAGTTLWRVHSRAYGSAEFNPMQAHEKFGGNRFDSTASDPYPYYYASRLETTALVETLVRGVPFDDRGYRLIPRRAVKERCLTAIRTARPLHLISLLSGPDLAAAGQDERLIRADGGEVYTQTRAVAHWLRTTASWAEGMIWRSLRDPDQPTLILFGDRCPDAFDAGSATRRDLSDTDGAKWLNAVLPPYRVAIRPPLTGPAA
ncbi:RES family NAD+ phosphorylase [Streptosporangiaceae bacterium NEAU-GS5]|nr:RES family NAD+ phosphorylase [Streptosporangiaceae bacterium NEAU-GS5]